MVDTGEIEETPKKLTDKNVLYDKDGATWMRSTDFGDDKDFVVVKSNGDVTYTTTDIAYHVNKFDRGFDHVIDVMGADHHGHVGPMEAGLEALGYDKKNLEFHLYQLVHLFRGGKQVKMSKSSGEFVTLEELLDEVGVDASRYFYLMRSSDTHLNFDLDLAKSKSMDNPVYYVQYAYVRCKAILANDELPEINLDEETPYFDGEAELNLVRDLISFPDEVLGAANSRTPNRICTYAEKLANSFHSFYHDCRVLGESSEIQKRRLLLVFATMKVIESALSILGVSAPDRM
ncbi:MAG: arginine--tRNA ligase [Caldisericia bacterium]